MVTPHSADNGCLLGDELGLLARYRDSDKDHELFQKDFLKATNKFMR